VNSKILTNLDPVSIPCWTHNENVPVINPAWEAVWNSVATDTTHSTWRMPEVNIILEKYGARVVSCPGKSIQIIFPNQKMANWFILTWSP
jgi:hypothetical protein